jgi:8-oxo-dGTP pyrophosphatase MutT (NUDIX family)
VSAAQGPVAQECVEGYLYALRPTELLIFRRGPARGRIWVPIQGKVEPTDADFEAAMRRELVEETGLSAPRRLWPLDWHVPFEIDGALWRLHAYAVEVDRGFVPVLNEENEAFEWVAPAEAERRLHFEDNRAAVARLLERLGPASQSL